jgi:hypothetical protein
LGIAVVDVFLLQRLISKERHIQQLIKESNIYSKEASSNNLPRRSEIISTTSLANKKRYITFALYGNDTMFTIGAIRNAMLAEYVRGRVTNGRNGLTPSSSIFIDLPWVDCARLCVRQKKKKVILSRSTTSNDALLRQ